MARQKVRVSRTRLLESALKVFEAYGSHKAILEVEYYGEVTPHVNIVNIAN